MESLSHDDPLQPYRAVIQALTPSECMGLAASTALRAMRLRSHKRDELFALAGKLIAQSQVAAARLSRGRATLQ